VYVGTDRPEKVDTRFVRKIRAALIEKETQAGRIGSEPEAVLADDVGAENEVLDVAV
jgi:hypothetical protein